MDVKWLIYLWGLIPAFFISNFLLLVIDPSDRMNSEDWGCVVVIGLVCTAVWPLFVLVGPIAILVGIYWLIWKLAQCVSRKLDK